MDYSILTAFFLFGGVKVKKYLLVSIIISLFLISCVSIPRGAGKPSWVNGSSVSNKVAGIGICGTHVNGKTAQRKLAIKRAIDEIASQLGVTVDNVTLMETIGTSSGASTSVESYSLQSVDGKVVAAVIKGTWQDPKTNELYIWMVTR